MKKIHLVPIDSPRAVRVDALAADIRKLHPSVEIHNDLQSGLTKAIEETNENDPIIVTGSFYLAGDLLRSLASKP